MSSTSVPMPGNVIEAALLPLWRYAGFRGRSSRMEFWSFIIVMNAVQILIAATIPFFSWHLMLVLLLPSQAVLVRRLHDVDRSGWWASPIPLLIFSVFFLFAMTQFTLGDEAGKQIFIGIGVCLLILLVLGIRLLVWTCRRGVPGPNRFGAALLSHDAAATSEKPPEEP